MRKIKPLVKSQLYTVCDAKQFNFKTTAELKELNDIIGQERALESMNFGIGIEHHGFNLYVQGPSGVGKHATIIRLLKRHVVNHPCPDDWCYVHNFSNTRKPLVLRVPHGYAKELKQDMDSFIEDTRVSIPSIFESDEYRQKMQDIDNKIKSEQEAKFAALQKLAEAEEMTLLSTTHGFAVAPTDENKKVISSEAFSALSPKERKEKEKKLENMKVKLMDLLAQVPRLHKKGRERKKAVQKSLTRSAIKYLLIDLRKKYQDLPNVIDYLGKVELDLIEHVGNFIETEDLIQKTPADNGLNLIRYQVNVLVSRDDNCVPIIYEDNPTYPNLIGRIDQKAQYGMLVTDHTLIRAGALHRANGGYLLVDANKLLTQPYAWAAIKRALYAREIRIDPISEMFGVALTTISLEPEAIPLDVKIIIIGDRPTYYLLCSLDPDFNELFKVEVDFNEEMERNKSNNLLYAQLLASLAKKANLLPFDHHAVARMIEHSSRLVNDAERLSLHMRSLDDLLRESDYWAKQEHHKLVKLQDVEKAIAQKCYRANRMQETFYEEIERGNMLIDTKSLVVGQINALSVLHLGDYQFGLPVRITAAVRLGKGDIVNIEREVNLSGDIHAKSVYILSGFIYNRYAKDYALSLLASLVFEQSYSEIEGDSASVPELCALLSAIGEFPLKQSLAVTGSVNQHGQVQPVGGINDKIEGYFAICDHYGLTGDHGVIIPAANVKHLMLNHKVIQAVSAKKFNIYAIETVDEALQLLTGLKAGQRDKEGKGNFTPGSCNAKVEQRLREFAMHSEGKS